MTKTVTKQSVSSDVKLIKAAIDKVVATKHACILVSDVTKGGTTEAMFYGVTSEQIANLLSSIIKRLNLSPSLFLPVFLEMSLGESTSSKNKPKTKKKPTPKAKAKPKSKQK